MRLLFVHEVDWRHKVVYEIHDFPELLSLRGHQVVFIDYPESREPRGVRRILDLKTESFRGLSRSHEGASVEVRTPGRVFPKPLDRLTASVTQVPAIRAALSRERYDAMILYGVPTNGWQSVMLARRYRVPVIFRAIDVSHRLRRTIYGPLIRLAESFVYRQSDALSANNEELRRYCVGLGAPRERTSVEYPGQDLGRFFPAPRSQELAAQFGIEPHHRVVLFMGTLYRFAGLDWLLRSSAELLRRMQHVRILLMGGGEEAARLRKLVNELGIAKSVIFTGVVDYPLLGDHLRLGDVAVNTMRRTLVTDVCLPAKVFQYLACGLATVSTPLPGLRSVLPSEDDGVLYRDGDDTFMAAVEELLTDENRRMAMSRAARARIESDFTWGRCTDAFERMIQRAVGAGGRGREDAPCEARNGERGPHPD
ncbi:MAG: glycosyltransferase family 4 protein [Thermoanaerobaculia bacterium]|nr:glycosyltransferase family 4 protein [Thermoanaerobaculia bacterium]